MTKSYWLYTHKQDDDLEEARFPTREQAQEVSDACEHGGDGYFSCRVLESEDEPNTTASDYLSVAWPDYPGPPPAGVEWADWIESFTNP